MCDIDLEPCDLWSEKQVKARKPHTCSCCGGAIKPGELYTKHFSKFEGDTTSEKACSACQAMRDEFLEIHKTVGNPGYMEDALRDCIEMEEYEGNDAMAKKWRGELDAMSVRREGT